MTMNSFADREWIQCSSNIWTILFTGTASLSKSQRCGARGHCQSLSNQLLFNGWNILKRHRYLCSVNTKKTLSHFLLRKTIYRYVMWTLSWHSWPMIFKYKWHLFINSLKSSAKAVLLHKHVSEQRSHTIHMKISFIMHLLVKHIRSDKYHWNVRTSHYLGLTCKWYIQHSGVTVNGINKHRKTISQSNNHHILMACSPCPPPPQKKRREVSSQYLVKPRIFFFTTY